MVVGELFLEDFYKRERLSQSNQLQIGRMVGVGNSRWLSLMKEHQTEIQGPLDLFRGLRTRSKTSYEKRELFTIN